MKEKLSVGTLGILIGAATGVLCAAAEIFLIARFFNSIKASGGRDGFAPGIAIWGFCAFLFPFAALFAVAAIRINLLIPAVAGLTVPVIGFAVYNTLKTK
ncbi:MAG: hypothetical protein LBQ91_04540 [Oscillospiraceae bacterium]|jgi:hypothetical protein|nr:hypothetical protein [Oscillospiraceae bacterium]